MQNFQFQEDWSELEMPNVSENCEIVEKTENRPCQNTHSQQKIVDFNNRYFDKMDEMKRMDKIRLTQVKQMLMKRY